MQCNKPYLIFVIFFLISISAFSQKTSKSVSDSLITLIEKNRRINNDSIVVWGTDLLRLSDDQKNDSLKYLSTKYLSYYYLRKRVFDSVYNYNELMLDVAKKLDSFKVVSSLQNKGAYYNEIGLNDSAMYVLKTAQKIGYNNLLSKSKADSLKKIKSILFIETAIVKNHFINKEFEEALKLTYSNLSTSNKYNITSFLAWNYFYLGLINLELGNYEEAEKYYKKELEYSIKQDNPRMEGFALMHLGNVYLAKQDIVNAKIKYLKADKLFNQNNYLKGKLLSKKKIFSIYEQEKNYAEAIRIGEEYISDYLKNGNLDDYLSAFYIELARVYYKLGKQSKGDQNMKIGLDFAKANPNINNVNLINQAYITYKELGNFKKALTEFELLTKLKDSLLLNEKFTKQLAEANEKYESEKSEKLIARNKEQIAQKELELKSKKNMILVFSVILLIVVVLGLFYLYRRLIKRINDKKQSEAFKYGSEQYLIEKYSLEENEIKLWLKLSENYSEKELAEIFFKSIDTIKYWRKSLYSKIKPEVNKQFKQKHAIALYKEEVDLYKSMTNTP